MTELSLHSINTKSPYKVERGDSVGMFKFTSDSGITFGVAFEEDHLLHTTESYQFAITNYVNGKSPRDFKVRETVIAVVTEFFAKNQAALLYICETGDGMQKMRNRLFHFWFSLYGENEDYLFLPMTVFDEDDNENYTALIIRRDHPRFNDAVSEYTNTVNVLNDKPNDSFDCF